MDWQVLLQEVYCEVEPHLGSGEVADYIPALAKIDPRKFGLAITTLDGARHQVGDAGEAFSIQSISKVFTLTLALECAGPALWRRTGREPSGTPFNSLVQLEDEGGIPRNPFINAGALIVTDVILSHCGEADPLEYILGFVRRVAGNGQVRIDEGVAASERAWGHRNVALANFMKSFGNLENDPEAVLEVYFHQCAIEMSCADLSRALLYLANDGTDPLSGERIVSPSRARRINSLMLTCGHYDASGDFAFRVGLPGKSGVGGGIAVVVPQRMAIAVWSPALNEQGSSLVGTLALEELASRGGLSVF